MCGPAPGTASLAGGSARSRGLKVVGSCLNQTMQASEKRVVALALASQCKESLGMGCWSPMPMRAGVWVSPTFRPPANILSLSLTPSSIAQWPSFHLDSSPNHTHFALFVRPLTTQNCAARYRSTQHARHHRLAQTALLTSSRSRGSDAQGWRLTSLSDK
jgi:hypothetical protein